MKISTTACGACVAPDSSRAVFRFSTANSNPPLSFVGTRRNPLFSLFGALIECCQISSTASGTPTPSPSNTRPRTVTLCLPAWPAFDLRAYKCESPIEKNGPTVCEAVGTSLISNLPSASRLFPATPHQTGIPRQTPAKYSPNQTSKSVAVSPVHRRCSCRLDRTPAVDRQGNTSA